MVSSWLCQTIGDVIAEAHNIFYNPSTMPVQMQLDRHAIQEDFGFPINIHMIELSIVEKTQNVSEPSYIKKSM